MRQQESQPDKQGHLSQFLLVILLLALYPLSLGPIRYLLFRDIIDQKTYDIVTTLYLPLIPWWDNNDRAYPNIPGRERFQNYLHLWETLGAEHQ